MSGGVDGGDVNQHDWNVVLNGVNAAADRAFEAQPVRVRGNRLFADRADEYV